MSLSDKTIDAELLREARERFANATSEQDKAYWQQQIAFLTTHTASSPSVAKGEPPAKMQDWPVHKDAKTELSADGWYWAGPIAVPYYGKQSEQAAAEIAEYVSRLVQDNCLHCEPASQGTMTAREWLIAGGGGHEDGEYGIRAGTISMEAAIELMDAFAAERCRGLERERDAAIVVLRAKCTEAEWVAMPEQFRAAESRLRERVEQIAKAIEAIHAKAYYETYDDDERVSHFVVDLDDADAALAALRKE